MKKLVGLSYVLFLAALTIHAQQNPKPHQEGAQDLIHGKSCGEARRYVATEWNAQQSCTIIYASDGTTVLAGNNEDYISPFGTIWFLPAENGKFGRVYFGWKDNGRYFPQGGMNDQGLFYDAATAKTVIVPPDTNKIPYNGALILKAMEECSSVEEALKLFDQYDTAGPWGGQYLIGDRFGNSAIIEPLTIIRKKGKYQIVTNFYQSEVPPEHITDARYRLASGIFDESEQISITLFRRILNAVHWEEYSGSMTVTLYSYICDLKKGDIYIYHFHNFEDPVKISLQDELKKGERSQPLVSLFPYETFAARRYIAQRIVGLLYERVLEEGVDDAIALFGKIKKGDYDNYQLSVVEGHLIALGYELLRNNKTKEAIEVFKYAVSEYPESANAYDSLGEAFMKSGDKENAKKNYQKSLELNPNNDNAEKMLKELEEDNSIF